MPRTSGVDTLIAMVSHAARTTGQWSPILVVEDDEAIRESLRDVLELEGWSVVQADNGRSALDLLEAGLTPSLVLLDLMMPVMNGLELLSRLRATKLFALLPVIIVSAWPQASLDLPAATQGFVKKPVDLEALLAAVARIAPRPTSPLSP